MLSVSRNEFQLALIFLYNPPHGGASVCICTYKTSVCVFGLEAHLHKCQKSHGLYLSYTRTKTYGQPMYMYYYSVTYVLAYKT